MQFDRGIEELEAILAAHPFAGATTEQALRDINAKLVGSSGRLTELMKLMRDIPGPLKKEKGQRANAVKTAVEAALEQAIVGLRTKAREQDLASTPIDVTLPGRSLLPGRLHPITRVKHELLDIFESLGFEVVTGPEIDTHANCFDKLGFPPDHPATDMQDTFFVTHQSVGDAVTTLLRTHTSTMQIREMSRRPPPLAVVSAGAVYRRDDDATHSPMFHQIEGFLVDKNVTMADLKGVLQRFLSRLYGDDIEVRLRPSYFPFVEPGAELDARRPGGPWMEIGGCGMIHPTVFEHVGYDPTQVSGFAFGMGIDRMAMVKYGITNIKHLFAGDVRFLESF